MSLKEHCKYFLKILLLMQKVIKLDRLDNTRKFSKKEIILIFSIKKIVSIQILLLNQSNPAQLLMIK